jgi:hypothetical protein
LLRCARVRQAAGDKSNGDNAARVRGELYGVETTPAVCVMLITLKRGDRVRVCAVQSFTTLFSLQVARNTRQIQRGHDVGR